MLRPQNNLTVISSSFTSSRSTIRDKIIPHAVSWFTGEAIQGDELEIEDDDEDEDIGDDDEDDEDEDEDEEEDEDEDEEEERKTKKKVFFLFLFDVTYFLTYHLNFQNVLFTDLCYFDLKCSSSCHLDKRYVAFDHILNIAFFFPSLCSQN